MPSRERPASTRFPLRGNDEGGAPSLPHRASTGRNGHAQNAVSSGATDAIRQQSDRYSDVLLHNSDTIRHPSDSLLTPDEEAARSGIGVVFSQGVGFCRVRQARLVGFAPSNRQRSAWVGIGERSGCHIVSGPSCNSWGDAASTRGRGAPRFCTPRSGQMSWFDRLTTNGPSPIPAGPSPIPAGPSPIPAGPSPVRACALKRHSALSPRSGQRDRGHVQLRASEGEVVRQHRERPLDSAAHARNDRPRRSELAMCAGAHLNASFR